MGLPATPHSQRCAPGRKIVSWLRQMGCVTQLREGSPRMFFGRGVSLENVSSVCYKGTTFGVLQQSQNKHTLALCATWISNGNRKTTSPPELSWYCWLTKSSVVHFDTGKRKRKGKGGDKRNAARTGVSNSPQSHIWHQPDTWTMSRSIVPKARGTFYRLIQ